MADDKPENPLIFPTNQMSVQGQVVPATFGMTLLDYFAGQALASFDTGFLSDISMLNEKTGIDVEELTAGCAYTLAEAMLKERQKRLN